MTKNVKIRLKTAIFVFQYFRKSIFVFMKAIIEYTDYRKFIQDYYDERKRSSAFTWREFARNAGFSSAVFLKYVCEGKKNLSISAAGLVANAMGLAGFEKTYFVLMVTYAHAKGDEAKMAAFEKRCALARAHKIRVLGGEEFDYYKSWKNPLLRELAPNMPGARPAEMARACKPKISTAEAVETLEFLEDAHLLKKDRNGNYVQTDKSISMGSVDAVPIAAKDLQRQMGELAVKALDLPLAERSMSGVVVGLTQDSYERIKQELLECRRRIIAIATESDKTQRVYRLNFQLFPISEDLDVANKALKNKEERNEKKRV